MNMGNAEHPLGFLATGHGAARLPSRQEIRQVVAQMQAELLACAQRGENPHHLALDHSDRVEAYAARLSTEDAAAFVSMFAEESQAAAAYTQAAKQRSEVQALGAGIVWYQIGSVMVALLLGLVLWIWLA